MRFIGEADGRNDLWMVCGLSWTAQRITFELCGGMLLAGLVMIAAGVTSELGMGDAVAAHALPLIFWVVGTGLRVSAFDLLIAVRRPGLAAIYSGFGPAVVTALGILGFIAGGLSLRLDNVLLLAAASAFGSGVTAHLALLRHTRRQTQGIKLNGNIARIPFFRVGLALVLSRALSRFDKQTIIFVLGHVASLQSVAIIGLTNQILLVVAMPLAAITNLILAEIARVKSGGGLRISMPRIRTLWSLTLVPVLAITLIIIAMAETVAVLVYGSEYTDLAKVLVVLTLGQLTLVVAGPAEQTLMMTGHERAMVVMSALKFLLLMLLTFVLGSQFGAIGGAWAFTLSALFISMLNTAYIRARLGLWVFAWVFPHSLRELWR
jgi:O-antigen/teichoic acid export membrane protein